MTLVRRFKEQGLIKVKGLCPPEEKAPCPPVGELRLQKLCIIQLDFQYKFSFYLVGAIATIIDIGVASLYICNSIVHCATFIPDDATFFSSYR
jgi:hypothetical protein